MGPTTGTGTGDDLVVAVAVQVAGADPHATPEAGVVGEEADAGVTPIRIEEPDMGATARARPGDDELGLRRCLGRAASPHQTCGCSDQCEDRHQHQGLSALAHEVSSCPRAWRNSKQDLTGMPEI